MPLLISTLVMFQAQNRKTINSTWKVAVSFKIIMKTSVIRSCFATQHQTCKTKIDFWSQTGLVLRPAVSDLISDQELNWIEKCLFEKPKYKYKEDIKTIKAERTHQDSWFLSYISSFHALTGPYRTHSSLKFSAAKTQFSDHDVNPPGFSRPELPGL